MPTIRGTGLEITEFNPDTIVTTADDFTDSDNRLPTVGAAKQYVDAQLLLPYEAAAVTMIGASTITLSGIPAGLNRIHLLLDAFSHNDNTATGDLLVRIGTGGVVLTTGYGSVSTTYGVTRSSTTGFILINLGSAVSMTAEIILERLPGTNRWKSVGHGKQSTAITIQDQWGDFITLSGDLDTITITTVSGTAVFDAGQVALRGYR